MRKLFFSSALSLLSIGVCAQAKEQSKDSILPAKYLLCLNNKGDTLKKVLPPPPGYAYDILNDRYVRVDKWLLKAKDVKKEEEWVPWPDWPGYRH